MNREAFGRMFGEAIAKTPTFSEAMIRHMADEVRKMEEEARKWHSEHKKELN
ncbi:MAG: hypothetical protein J6Y37_14460 [Paludibacteraceae bacterium]|nr:hypothetical protein [Paludibacteraceae bacterium]